MNILQVGPNSIHVTLFSKAMIGHGVNCSFLAEENIGSFETQVISFRSANPLSWILNYQQLKSYLKKYKACISSYPSGKSFGSFCCSSLS